MSSPNSKERIWRIAAILAPSRSLPQPEQKVKVHAGAATKATRYGFIDLLRGFALVMMVETHVVNAYLPVALRKGSEFFFWLSFVNGLVAPGFLFAAGFSIVLQGNSQWDNWLHFRLPFWKQMRRLGFITLVAYYSHLEGFKLSRYLRDWGDRAMWTKTLQVDILQCIVVSLLFVHLLLFVLRRRNLLAWASCLLTGCVAFVTPWMWSRDFSRSLPLSMALFLNPHGVSLFPIFPWLCFVLAGSCAACFFLKSVELRRIPEFIRGIAILGALMIIAGVLLRSAPYTLPGHSNFYTTSPLYVVIRIGCILLITALLYHLEAGMQWVPRPIQLAGQESLLVYGVHLWFIFALLRGKHVGRILGLETGYLGCLFLSSAIILLMLCLAKYWHALKKGYPGYTKLGQTITVLIMIAVFLLS